MADPHRFWRLQQSASVGGLYVQIAEVSFRGAELQDLSVGGTAFASSEYSAAYAASKAFDKSVATQWCTVLGQFPGWVAYDHGTPVAVSTVQVTWDTSPSYLPPSETAISVSWSDNGSDWSAPAAVAIASGTLSAGATTLFTLVEAKPLIVLAAPQAAHVLGSAYTGPYGHASTTPQPQHAGDYKTGLLGTNTGTVYGTTEVKTDPSDKPVRARVLLLREKDGKVIREMWSDPVTGAYRFDDVDTGEVYTVLTYHPTRDRRAVVADGIIPEVSA